MKTLNNMLWMFGGVGVGIALKTYSKDIKKMFNKTTKSVGKMTKE